MSGQRAFSAHLKRLNARRLRPASWYFALLLALLFAVNVGLPSLRLWPHAVAQLVSMVYFLGLGIACRTPRAAAWPVAALPLLFGGGAVATGLAFSLDLAPTLGANPAYATTLLLGCGAPLWPRRLLLAVLVPVHLVYLLTVFLMGQGTTFVLLMVIGGTIAAAFGWFVALLQYRTERRTFATAATIRRQNDELGRTLARVNRLLDERSDMVATVAHDLQSPLAGIRALLRTVPDRADGDGAKLREIARTCADMQGAITRLLEAHAAESEEIAFRPVALDALFAEVAAIARPPAAEKGITIVCDAGGLVVRGEPLLLARALGNLVSNAVKFSPRGAPVRIEAKRHGEEVRIAVIDRGPGIAPDDVKALFGKFRRLGAQPTGDEPTTGLGLYIVQGLAARLKATVGHEANPEGGSVFFIDLAASG